MRFPHGLLILSWVSLCWGAQTPRGIKGPPSAEQRRTLEGVKAYLAEYKKQMPEFFCTPLFKTEDSDALAQSGELRSVVMVDLGPSERDSPSETTKSVAVEPLIRDLFTEDVKFTFIRWAKVHRKRVAVYRYKKKSRGGVRQAEFYLDQESGTVTRIVFEDADIAEHVPLFCRTARK